MVLMKNGIELTDKLSKSEKDNCLETTRQDVLNALSFLYIICGLQLTSMQKTYHRVFDFVKSKSTGQGYNIPTHKFIHRTEIFDFVTECVKRCIAAIVVRYGVYILCNKRCCWSGELAKGFWRGYLYNLFIYSIFLYTLFFYIHYFLYNLFIYSIFYIFYFFIYLSLTVCCNNNESKENNTYNSKNTSYNHFSSNYHRK